MAIIDRSPAWPVGRQLGQGQRKDDQRTPQIKKQMRWYCHAEMAMQMTNGIKRQYDKHAKKTKDIGLNA